MKKLLWLVLLVAFVPKMAGAYGVVRNASASQTSEDSLVFPVLMPDSMGNPIGKIDSIFIMVIGPSGDSVKAEKIAGIAAGTNWTSYIKRGAAIGWDSCTFVRCQVSNVVVTGSPGVYTVIIQGYAAAGGSTSKRARYAYQFQYIKSPLSQSLYAARDSILRPTTIGRTLDVSTGGEAGLDWANIGSPTTSVALSGTSVLLTAGTSTGQLDFTSGVVKSNMTQVLGGAVPAVTTTGVPKVDVVNWKGTGVDTTGYSGRINVDLQKIAGVAVSTSTAQIGVNAVNIGGTAAASATIGTTTNLTNWPSGALSATNLGGVLDLDTTGHHTANTIGQILNVNRTKLSYLPSVTAGASGGLFIAGTNAATSITTGLTAHIIGTVDSATAVGVGVGGILASSFGNGALGDSTKYYNTSIVTDTTFKIWLRNQGWYLPMNTVFPAGSMGDSANNNGFYGPGASGSGLTATQANRLNALYSRLVDGDTLVKIRYISPYGDNSDGTTMSKARTSPNYAGLAADSNTIWIIGDGKYDTVHVEILARNVSLLGNGRGRTIFVADSTGSSPSDPDIITVYKPNCTISGIEFRGRNRGLSDLDPARWCNPITVYGTGHNCSILRNFFREGYKTIVSIDTVVSGKCDTARAPRYLEIGYCEFERVQMFAIDVNPWYGYIHDNIIRGIQSNIDNGAAGIQLFTRSHSNLITRNYIDSVGIGVACVNDTNTVISHNNWGYFFPYGARITNNSGSVNCTVDEPSLFPVDIPRTVFTNKLPNPGLELYSIDRSNPIGWGAPGLSRTLPGDSTFPDARVVTAKFHTGAFSWYANCLYHSDPATNQQQVSFWLDSLSNYCDTGLYMASAWVWAVNGSITSIKIRDFGQNNLANLNWDNVSQAYTDSTYDTTQWSNAKDSQWVQVRSYFRHTRTGRVKVQFITHHNSICYWDDFFFGKVENSTALATLDTLGNSASSLRSSSTLTLSQANLDSIVAGVLSGIGGGSGGGVPVTVSGNSYATIGSLRVAIREATQIYDQSLMPDSVINDAAVRAAVGVSTDVGGYEASLSFQTVPGVSRYPLSDTIINVIYGWVKSGQGSVYALKSWYPQFFDDFKLPTLSGENTDQETPVCYRLWADSVELLPTPSKVDTVKMDVLVQHPFVSVLPGQDGLKLRPTFFDAILYRACRDLMVGIDLTEKANAFGGLYEAKKKELLEAYARRLDVRGTK